MHLFVLYDSGTPGLNELLISKYRFSIFAMSIKDDRHAIKGMIVLHFPYKNYINTNIENT